MSRTLGLILVLIATVIGLLALSLNLKTPSPSIQPSQAETTLALTQPVASSSGILTSNVLVNTAGNNATAVQIELSYDPSYISIKDVAPGTFLKSPVELFKKIDEANGRVSYALGAGIGQKSSSGSGVVAVLSFTKLKTSGKTSISFLPKSEVSQEEVAKSVLNRATGITLDLSQ